MATESGWGRDNPISILILAGITVPKSLLDPAKSDHMAQVGAIGRRTAFMIALRMERETPSVPLIRGKLIPSPQRGKG